MFGFWDSLEVLLAGIESNTGDLMLYIRPQYKFEHGFDLELKPKQLIDILGK
jgi:hypothetical protein